MPPHAGGIAVSTFRANRFLADDAGTLSGSGFTGIKGFETRDFLFNPRKRAYTLG